MRPTDERAPPDEDAIATIPESEPDRISEPMPDPITDDSDAVDEGEIRLSLVETDLKPPEGSGDGAEMSIEDLAETGISPSRPDPLRELLNRSLSSRPNNDIEDEPDDLGKTDEVAALPIEREEERVEPTVEDMPPATPEIPAVDPAPMVASTPPSRDAQDDQSIAGIYTDRGVWHNVQRKRRKKQHFQNRRDYQHNSHHAVERTTSISSSGWADSDRRAGRAVASFSVAGVSRRLCSRRARPIIVPRGAADMETAECRPYFRADRGVAEAEKSGGGRSVASRQSIGLAID